MLSEWPLNFNPALHFQVEHPRKTTLHTDAHCEYQCVCRVVTRQIIEFLFWGATFHIPLTKSATLNRLSHCTLWQFSGAIFFFFLGLFFVFRGQKRPEPPLFFSLVVTWWYSTWKCKAGLKLGGRSLELFPTDKVYFSKYHCAKECSLHVYIMQ